MVNHPRRSTVARLAGHARVEHVDDERSLGNGVLITLRQGWAWDPMQDNRVRGFNTASDALRAVQAEALTFAGPYTR